MKRRILLLAALGLAACDGNSVNETLGLDRNAPDEFTVVSRPSLSVPPEFTLRPPRPGEPPRAPTAEDTARGLLTGQGAKPKETIDSIMEPSNPTAVTPVLSSETPSGATAQFLKRAGAGQADEKIREKLTSDQTAPVDTSQAKSLIEKLQTQDKKEPVIDPKKEAERLRANKDSGKPANEGEVAVEPIATPSLLDRWF